MKPSIPFNRVNTVGKEFFYIREAFDRMHISGDGDFSKRCGTFLETTLGAPKVLLTTSCTHALEMAALLLDLKPGDEVILPSFTFVSTVNAIVLRGARPVFVDIRPDTLNIDERLVEQRITEATKAIICVHYAGVGCDMDKILQIANHRGIPVVEDNAHGLFGKYRDKSLGSFGCLATQSFHETKNFSCGEGGALVINDPDLIERAEIIREKGTNRSRFFRGQVDKYTWVDVGSSYLLSDILAAILWAQLEARDSIQAKRKAVWERYMKRLSPWAAENRVQLPVIPPECEQTYHIFYMLLPDLDARQRLIEQLKSRGILAVFHYVPLHLSDMGKRFGGYQRQCPVTESVSERLVRLPLYAGLSQAEQDQVIDAVYEFRFTKWRTFAATAS